MISDLTALKLDAALLQLELQQRQGEDAPAPGQLSQAELARRSGLSESTINGIERIALAKLARGLMDQDLPPHLTKIILAHFDKQHTTQPELF